MPEPHPRAPLWRFVSHGLLCAAVEYLYQGALLRWFEVLGHGAILVGSAALAWWLAQRTRGPLRSALLGLGTAVPVGLAIVPLLWLPSQVLLVGGCIWLLASYQHHSEGERGAPLPPVLIAFLLALALGGHHQQHVRLTVAAGVTFGVGLAIAAALASFRRAWPALLLVPLATPLHTPFHPRTASGHAAELPDILIISVDTLRAEEGNRMQLAQRLAEDGVLFQQAHTSSSWTLPSMATLFTGLPFNQHAAGLHPIGFRGVPEELDLLTERLAAAGYDTAAVIADNPYLDEAFGLPAGFASFDIDQSMGRWSLLRLLRPAPPVEAHIAQAERVLRQRRDGPVFLWLHLLDCHLPYPQTRRPREERLELEHRSAVLLNPEAWASDEARDSIRRAYQYEVDSVDEALLGLVDRLPPAPHGRIIILTSDHGEEFFEHDLFEHGHSFYQEVSRIPLIISGAGHVGVEERPAGLVDVAPTLLNLLGLGDPELPGRDLFAQLPDPEPGYVIENLLYEPGPRFAVRQGDWKAIIGAEPQLFDLSTDPGEQNNLFEAHPERFYALMELRPEDREWAPSVVGISAEQRARLQALGYLASP